MDKIDKTDKTDGIEKVDKTTNKYHLFHLLHEFDLNQLPKILAFHNFLSHFVLKEQDLLALLSLFL